MRNSYKGKYTPKNPSKYKGDPSNVIYRSLLERRFMVFCDNQPNILEWASEEFCIPYMYEIDQQIHRYFPDFWIKKQNKDGKIEELLIEVKPKIQCQPPKQPKRKTKYYLEECYTWVKNQNKWNAAKDFCRTHNMKFVILTEENLKPGKPKK